MSWAERQKIMVTVKRYGKGICMLQNVETEGVEVEFLDGGLKGFLAWNEFRRLLKARSEAAKEKPRTTPHAGAQVTLK